MTHERRFQGDIDRLRSPERVQRLEVERVVSLCLQDEAFRTALDVGTGSGLFAEEFARRGLDVAGVDVNPEMLTAARRHVPTGEFREGTAESLPFPDASFDLVFLGLVLHETDDLARALAEARRAARQRVAILEWPYREQPFGPPLADRLDPRNLEEHFRSAGFHAWRTGELTNTVLYLLQREAV